MSQYCIEPPADLSSLPDPPVPAGLDLRHFDWMHLHTKDLLDSPIWDECSDAEIASALRLWAKAWQQVPCSSLPNDLKKVRAWAGCEGRLKRWKSVQKGALRGFALCNDGRLYHHKVAEAANNAASKSRAGKKGAKAKWEKVNALKNHNTGHAVADGKPNGKANGKRPDIIYGRPHGRTDAEKGREDPSPLPPSFGAAAGSGSLDAPPDRPTIGIPSPDPEFVEVTIESGAKLRITRNGQVDEVWAPLDCPETAMTRKQALELRANALAARDPPAKPEAA